MMYGLPHVGMMQGYGVRLDLKNMEYKAVDDSNTGEEEQEEQEGDIDVFDGKRTYIFLMVREQKFPSLIRVQKD